MNEPINPEVLAQPHMTWDSSIWFSDVDDTLIDTAGTSTEASEGIREVFEVYFGVQKAEEVQQNFNILFALMMAGYRVRDDDWTQVSGGKEAFERLLEYVESCQQQVIAAYGHYKKWSREIFIKRACELAGIDVEPELVHEAADSYWMTLTERTEVFPDALKLSDSITEHNCPLFLVTSSDARLKMQPDGQFVYDPGYSEGLKRQRMELLREKGLRFRAISIGDPEDKPHPNFFTKAINLAESDLGISIEPGSLIMLGDSFGGDLQTPKEQLGFGLVVLRNSECSKTHINDTHQVTLGNLVEIERFLS